MKNNLKAFITEKNMLNRIRSEEHTSELQSRQYLHSLPTRRSSDLVFNSMKEAINKFEIFKSNEKQLKSFHHRKKYVKQNPKPKIYKDPAETIIKNKQSRIFVIFNKIIEANEFITYETFLKFKGRNIPHIKTVFESIEDAIEKYQIFPKRYIPKTNIIN